MLHMGDALCEKGFLLYSAPFNTVQHPHNNPEVELVWLDSLHAMCCVNI